MLDCNNHHDHFLDHFMWMTEPTSHRCGLELDGIGSCRIFRKVCASVSDRYSVTREWNRRGTAHVYAILLVLHLSTTTTVSQRLPSGRNYGRASGKYEILRVKQRKVSCDLLYRRMSIAI